MASFPTSFGSCYPYFPLRASCLRFPFYLFRPDVTVAFQKSVRILTEIGSERRAHILEPLQQPDQISSSAGMEP